MKTLLLKKPRDIIRSYGIGYYRASLLFPAHIREAVWTLYKFVRVPDEIVDNPRNKKDIDLDQWEALWNDVLAGRVTKYQSLHAFKDVVDRYKIPLEYVRAFFIAMRQDTRVARYKTYGELEAYMYGSATVVGYMMSYIIGFRDGALPRARALAEAFQMTNFLRDIQSDYHERGRIYIPKEDMDRFGVTEQHIARGVVDDAWKALMAFEVARTRALYKKGVDGIRFLDPQGRKAVYAAALIYEDILRKIERAEYDIFTERIVVGRFRKTMLLWKALWYKNQ